METHTGAPSAVFVLMLMEEVWNSAVIKFQSDGDL